MNIRNIEWRPLLVITNLIVINLVMILFLNRNYPMAGSDYGLALPAMLDTVVHFYNNGLTIQWYTPSFGGGVPAFANPNNGQFSLLEILPLWMDTWQAVNISSIIYISLGFLASYRIFTKILKLSWQASILGAVFFSANGFMMERLAVGHLGYQPFPLLAIVLLLFFDTTISSIVAGLLLGLVATLLIHQAGYFLIIVFGLSIAMVLPLISLVRPDMVSWKRLTTIFFLGSGIALLISASKLSAVFSYMRFFPRTIADNYSANMIQGILGIILQLLGTMSLVPLLLIANIDPNLLATYLALTTSAYYGYWELDMSASPVIFWIILVGASKFLRTPREYIKRCTDGKKWGAVLLFIVSIWLAVEFTLGKGWLYPYMRQLPILSSMHVNPRFAVAFLFPLAAVAAVLYDASSAHWAQKKTAIAFILVNILTLLPLSSYFILSNDLQQRTYNVTEAGDIYRSIRAGDKFEITGIGADETNTQALEKGLSNLNLYDPIFGYELENFHPEITAGPIWNVSNGYYNMTNPSGYVFPEINDSRPFERIRIQDRDKLAAFAAYHQPEWKIPLYQQVFNWISVSALSLTVVLLFLLGFRKWRGQA